MNDAERDIATVIADLQREIQIIRDLALFAPAARQKLYVLQTAELIEHCIRHFDRQA